MFILAPVFWLFHILESDEMFSNHVPVATNVLQKGPASYMYRLILKSPC